MLIKLMYITTEYLNMQSQVEKESLTWLTVRCKWMVEDCSQWTLTMSAPAFTKSGTRCSGSTIICSAFVHISNDILNQQRPDNELTNTWKLKNTRCTSNGRSVTGRSAPTTRGPIVMFGTKRPSITSTWIQSQPASSTALTYTFVRVKL